MKSRLEHALALNALGRPPTVDYQTMPEVWNACVTFWSRLREYLEKPCPERSARLKASLELMAQSADELDGQEAGILGEVRPFIRRWNDVIQSTDNFPTS